MIDSAKTALRSQDPEERLQAAKFLEDAPSQQQALAIVAKADAVDRFLADLKKKDKLRDYYRHKYQDIQKDWRLTQ